MSKYVALLSFTGEGISDIKKKAERVAAAKDAVESVGGTWIGYYVTLGQYDGVAIMELPDDSVAAQVVVAIGGAGNVRTETMRAFTIEEFSDIVKSVS
jgi:uncharacterized protein with GYD domain